MRNKTYVNYDYDKDEDPNQFDKKIRDFAFLSNSDPFGVIDDPLEGDGDYTDYNYRADHGVHKELEYKFGYGGCYSSFPNDDNPPLKNVSVGHGPNYYKLRLRRESVVKPFEFQGYDGKVQIFNDVVGFQHNAFEGATRLEVYVSDSVYFIFSDAFKDTNATLHFNSTSHLIEVHPSSLTDVQRVYIHGERNEELEKTLQYGGYTGDFSYEEYVPEQGKTASKNQEKVQLDSKTPVEQPATETKQQVVSETTTKPAPETVGQSTTETTVQSALTFFNDFMDFWQSMTETTVQSAPETVEQPATEITVQTVAKQGPLSDSTGKGNVSATSIVNMQNFQNGR